MGGFVGQNTRIKTMENGDKTFAMCTSWNFGLVTFVWALVVGNNNSFFIAISPGQLKLVVSPSEPPRVSFATCGHAALLGHGERVIDDIVSSNLLVLSEFGGDLSWHLCTQTFGPMNLQTRAWHIFPQVRRLRE